MLNTLHIVYITGIIMETLVTGNPKKYVCFSFLFKISVSITLKYASLISAAKTNITEIAKYV